MIDPKTYKPMDCPVCGEFHFSELDESDAEIYDYLQCPQCGWKYDLKQMLEPDIPTGLNAMSLSEFRENSKQKIADNPQYNYQDEQYQEVPHLCPVCGQHTFPDEGSFEICPVCGWLDDSVMENEPDKWAGCSNDLCLNDFRARYKEQLVNQEKPDKK